MANSFEQKTRIAICVVLSALAAAVAGSLTTAAEAPIHFVAPAASQEKPANETPSSTVSITETTVESTPAPTLKRMPNTEMIDLAALASFAQAAAEEIQGQPELDASRPFRPISQVTADAALPNGLWPGQPGTEQAGAQPSPIPEFGDPRLWHGWSETTYNWAATQMRHRHLYFEEVNLERYGYTVSPIVQPGISAAHFFLTIPTIPYKLVAQPPREEVYTLGYYRPGSPAPRRWHHVNWDPTAATVQGLVVTGLVFAIP